MSRNEVSNSQDIIDSRDVIARIRELESDKEDLQSAIADAKQAVEDFPPCEFSDDAAEELNVLREAVLSAQNDLDNWDDADELKVLLALQNEADGYSDRRHGETLIRESYFEMYAREFAEDVCDMKQADKWPFNCIDWEQAASELCPGLHHG